MGRLAISVFVGLVGSLAGCSPAGEDLGVADDLTTLDHRLVHEASGIVLIRVEPGTYTMGTPDWEDDRDGDESRREASVGAFLLGETEVTVGQWRRVMGTEPPLEQDDDEEPVMGVTWHAAMKFLELLNDEGGGGWRLPSEAEWEYACRAGTQTPFSFGETLSADQANYNGERPYNGGERGVNRDDVVPVRSFEPNPWGFYDMHGNVWEWCSDLYVFHPGRDRPSDAEGAPRSMRGGAFTSKGEQLRSGYRDGYPPKSTGAKYGFRVARSLD